MATIFPILATLGVGGVFLITGIIKALAPTSFLTHIKQLQLFPHQFSVTIAMTFTIIECSLGTALILRLFPQWVIPMTIFLLLGLTALSYWSTTTGRTDSCGCYSGLLEVTPQQSLLLNTLYIILLGFAYLSPVNNIFTNLQQGTTLCICLAINFLLTTASYLYYRKKGMPFLDLTVLKVNRSWQSKWLPENTSYLITGSHIVAFLNPNCSMCKTWIMVLNVVHKRADLPNVLAAVVGTSEIIEEFAQIYQLSFPVVAVSPSVKGRLVSNFPTAVVLKNGVIQDKWLGVMPASFIERIKQKENVLIK